MNMGFSRARRLAIVSPAVAVGKLKNDVQLDLLITLEGFIMFSNRIVVSLATVVSLTFTGTAFAASSDGSTMARQGIVRCGSNVFLRQGSTEINWTSHSLKNYDAVNPITIDRMRFFYADGTTLFDSSITGLPASENGVLGPANNILGPYQSANFSNYVFLPLNLTADKRPLILEVAWSSAKPVLTLEVNATRIVRDFNFGVQGADRSRHAGSCRTVYAK